MKQLTPINELNRAVSATYRHAADGVLEWKSEKSFFEAQIRRNPMISRAVNNNVPATIESLKLAVRECASMGLSMSPQAQLVYFIPRKARRRKTGESTADYDRVPHIVTATPSYRGLAYIATNYAGAELVAAEVVFADDKFRYFGPILEPQHEPTLDNTRRNEKNAIGAYAVVRMKNGSVRAEYVDAPTVQKIRQLSDFPNGLMWTTLWTEGWRKVPIRRICKTVMVTDRRMSAAVATMERAESVDFEDAEFDDRPSGVAGLAEAMRGKQIIDHEPFVASESDHPPGSIEWWIDQINGADTMARMDDIKAAALADGVDTGDDANAFRDHYADRCKQIRAA